MAILRGLKAQLLTDRRLRIAEFSIVDAEGVMVDGHEEIEDYYAGIIGNSATALPRDPARFKSAAQSRGTACLGPEFRQSQGDFYLAPRYKTSERVATGFVQPNDAKDSDFHLEIRYTKRPFR